MLDALLRKGYLPQELPPLFSTDSFATCVKKTMAQLPSSFIQKKAPWTEATHHNLARVGGLRRRLSAPNPISFFRLSNTFDLNATALKRKWAASPYSRTKPMLSASQPRAIAPMNLDRAPPRALVRVGARYLVRADIAQFYHSIYTHTISWAAHTKKVGKANFDDMTLFGNVLDRELQACQHGQTKGIAIGPDTSLGIAELLLSRIDCRMARECNIRGAVRFIDDMEFSFTKLADAESALSKLEGMLYGYELQLNSTKTKIVELPNNIESPYVTELRQHIPNQATVSRSEWIDFFNKAFLLAEVFPTEGVLRYAVACSKNVKVKANLWELVQALLWQCIAGDPGCLRFVIDVLWLNTHRDDSLKLDKELAQHALDALILRSAPVGHGSEVLWSVWAALLFDLRLSNDSSAEISMMDDSFVATAALYANEKGIFLTPPNTDLWESWFEPQCFLGNHWLLTFEAYRRDWMPDKVKNAALRKDPTCRFLKQSGVSFIRDDASSLYRPKGYQPVIAVGGGY